MYNFPDNLTENISQAMDLILDAFRNAVSQMNYSTELVAIFSQYLRNQNTEVIRCYQSLMEVANQSITEALRNATMVQLPEISIPPLSEPAIEALESLLEHVRENSQDDEVLNYVQIAKPQLQEMGNAPITLDRVLTIINTLFALFALLISLQPSEQLERIIEQNERLIDQTATISEKLDVISHNQEHIVENDSDKELRMVLFELSDSIQNFQNLAQMLVNETDDFNNSTISESQNDIADTIDDADNQQ